MRVWSAAERKTYVSILSFVLERGVEVILGFRAVGGGGMGFMWDLYVFGTWELG